MRVHHIHHVSIVVRDLERSRRWYRDVLQLAEAPIPSTFGFDVAWFQFGDQQLHLLPRAQGDPASPRHYALWLDDARAWREHLQSLQIPIQETTPIPGADRFFIRDPDGNLIEMIEWKIPWPQGDPQARSLPPLDG